MPTYTPNRKLILPGDGENADIDDLKYNFGIIDSALNVSRDFLDNDYFSVNQRGLTRYTGAAQYTVDRWKTTNADTVVDVLENGIRLTNTVTGSGGYFQQTLENPARFLGKTLTLAAMQTNGTLTVASATLPTSFPAAVTQYATLTDGGVSIGAIQMNSNLLWVRVWSNPAEVTRSFRWVALYEGSFPANALSSPQPQPPSVELLECQRYHLPLSDYVRYPVTRCTASEIDFLIPIPVRFRYNPTLVGTMTVYAGSTAQTGFSFSVAALSSNAVAIRAAKTNHGLSGSNGVYLQVTNAALNADL